MKNHLSLPTLSRSRSVSHYQNNGYKKTNLDQPSLSVSPPTNNEFDPSPVEEVYELEAELVVDVLLCDLGVYLRRHHETQKELVHQLQRNKPDSQRRHGMGWYGTLWNGRHHITCTYAYSSSSSRVGASHHSTLSKTKRIEAKVEKQQTG